MLVGVPAVGITGVKGAEPGITGLTGIFVVGALQSPNIDFGSIELVPLINC
jgi:hypothetical protein